MVDLYIVMLVYQRVKPPFSYDFPWFSIGYWMTEISAPTYSVTLNPKDLGDISAHHIFFRPAMCGEKIHDAWLQVLFFVFSPIGEIQCPFLVKHVLPFILQRLHVWLSGCPRFNPRFCSLRPLFVGEYPNMVESPFVLMDFPLNPIKMPLNAIKSHKSH